MKLVSSRSRSRSFAITARRTTTGPVETQRGGRSPQTDKHKTPKGTDTKGAGVSRQRRESGGEPSSSSQTLPARVYRSIHGKPPRCLARGSSSLGFLSNKPLDLNRFTFIRRLHVHPCTFIGGPGAGRARQHSPIAPTNPQARGWLLAVESTREGPRACLFKLLLLWVFVNLNCRANVRDACELFLPTSIMKSC